MGDFEREEEEGFFELKEEVFVSVEVLGEVLEVVLLPRF